MSDNLPVKRGVGRPRNPENVGKASTRPTKAEYKAQREAAIDSFVGGRKRIRGRPKTIATQVEDLQARVETLATQPSDLSHLTPEAAANAISIEAIFVLRAIAMDSTAPHETRRKAALDILSYGPGKPAAPAKASAAARDTENDRADYDKRLAMDRAIEAELANAADEALEAADDVIGDAPGEPVTAGLKPVGSYERGPYVMTGGQAIVIDQDPFDVPSELRAA